jgi:hypothetical protein
MMSETTTLTGTVTLGWRENELFAGDLMVGDIFLSEFDKHKFNPWTARIMSGSTNRIVASLAGGHDGLTARYLTESEARAALESDVKRALFGEEGTS